MIEFTLPIRTYSLPNMRWHWTKKAKYAKQQRLEAYIEAKRHGVTAEPLGAFTVRLVRIGKKRLDDDNLAASFKHIRDGIADVLKIDDGSEQIKWVYDQRIGKTYEISIKIECSTESAKQKD